MYLITFETTHQAMEAQDVLDQAQFYSSSIPLPLQFGQLCGISVRIKEENKEAIYRLFKEKHLSFEGFYAILQTGYHKEYRLWKH